MMKILNYFPDLTAGQRAQFEALDGLYREWNAKINVISRKDIDNLYEHHVLHSLAIARFFPFSDGLKIVDVGCGGGFPGIPLAILYPGCQFLLVDRINKKLTVAQEVANAIGLTNVQVRHAGIEEVKEQFDYAVSRAVMPLPDLLKLVKRCTRRGLITLKGGDLGEELRPAICRGTRVEHISQWFSEEFFETKLVTFTPFSHA